MSSTKFVFFATLQGSRIFFKNLLATGMWRQKIHLPTQEIYFPDKSLKKINSEHLIPCLPNMKVVLIIFARA